MTAAKSDNLSSMPRTHVIGELALFGLHSYGMAHEMCAHTNKCVKKKIKKVGFISGPSVRVQSTVVGRRECGWQERGAAGSIVSAVAVRKQRRVNAGAHPFSTPTLLNCSLFVCLSICCFFETGSHWVPMADLQLAM